MTPEPLAIRCKLRGSADVVTAAGKVHLDALLAAMVARREHLPPILDTDDVTPIEIPVEREPKGRFHLASMLIGQVEHSRLRWVQRRFPLEQAQKLSTMKSVHLGSGAQKNFRIPVEAQRLADDELVGWALGDRAAVAELLCLVTHLGKHRARGSGRVRSWSVEVMTDGATWDGFPVLSPDGDPLRPLPIDWPHLRTDARREQARLTYPYWLPDREPLAMP